MEIIESTKLVENSAKKPPAAGNGRPKGSMNKNTKAIKDMILAALDKAGGEEYLLRQSEENPTAFLTLVGKILPSELNAKVENSGNIGLRIEWKE